MQIKNFNVYFFMFVLIGISVLAFFLFKPFLTAILASAILAATFQRSYKIILGKLKSSAISSLATCLLVLAVIVLPTIVVLGLVANEIGGAYTELIADNGFYKSRFTEIVSLAKDSQLARSFNLHQFLEGDNLNKSIQNIGSGALTIIQKTYQNIISATIWMFVMFFTLYYFLIEGKKVLEKIMYLSPLKDKYEEELKLKFISMTRATLKGTIIIGVIQGALGGIALWIAGVPSFIVWGVIMVILSIIPAIGPALIWAPVGVILLLMGNVWQGVFVLAFGGIVISSIDNILRPKLVGNDTEMHPLLVFFATLGGLVSFGIIGFIIGPIIMALFLSLWEIYGKEFKSQLKKINA